MAPTNAKSEINSKLLYEFAFVGAEWNYCN